MAIPVKKNPSSSESAATLLDCLPLVMWFVRRHMRRHQTASLSVPQFRALVFLSRYPCTTLSSVAESVGSTLPTASRIVSGLVRKKFVRRKGEVRDRRKLSLELTPRGKKALHTATRATKKQIARAFNALNPNERRTVSCAMLLLQEAFDPRRDEVKKTSTGGK